MKGRSGKKENEKEISVDNDLLGTVVERVCVGCR